MCAYMLTHVYISAEFRVDVKVVSKNRHVWKVHNSDSSDISKFHPFLQASEKNCYTGVTDAFQ